MSEPIHQFVHTLSYGDAISGEAIALQRCFKALGRSSEIYAINTHPKYKGLTKDYRDFIRDNGPQYSGEILLHYSLGSPLNDLYRSQNSARRSMIYHNLTPAHWFHGVNPRIADDIEQGVRELPELCRITDNLIADSSFNAGELSRLGFTAAVLELPIDPERWNISSNPGIASLLSSNPGIHILHVGRIAPNKCIEDLIKTFYFLHHYINRSSHLWLPGIDIDTELYSFALKRLTHELDLADSVHFVGCLDDSEIKALYEGSSVYLCMSEHEGFCLPVVEAMHFSLPVISYASSALPDTIGDAGILVHEKRPAELAEVISELCANQELRSRLVSAGKSRVSQLSFEHFSAKVAELWSSTAKSPQSSVYSRRA